MHLGYKIAEGHGVNHHEYYFKCGRHGTLDAQFVAGAVVTCFWCLRAWLEGHVELGKDA